ncbi:MAG: hypothetical protein ACRDWY_10860 [Actinomycetes bacterium]
MDRSRAAIRRHLPTSPFQAQVAKPVEQFEVGDRVTHDRFGLGTVIGVEEGVAATVDFGAQRVRVAAPFALLSKI